MSKVNLQNDGNLKLKIAKNCNQLQTKYI